jgi:hypothetical protein
MDDSSVSQVSINTVLKQQAYILFYLQSNLKIAQNRSSETEKMIATQMELKSHESYDQLNSELDDHREFPPKRKIEEPQKPLQAPVRHEDDDELSDVLFLAKKQKIDVTEFLESMKSKTSANCPTTLFDDREKTTRLPPRRFGIFRLV